LFVSEREREREREREKKSWTGMKKLTDFFEVFFFSHSSVFLLNSCDFDNMCRVVTIGVVVVWAVEPLSFIIQHLIRTIRNMHSFQVILERFIITSSISFKSKHR
jgi:hypothetical protein